MQPITIKDKNFVPMIDRATLETRIAALAGQISADYAGRQPLFVAVLNGSFMFVAQLMKGISVACDVTFVRVASYQATESSGVVKEILGLTEDIRGRDVIIVEDIVDTGLTMFELCGQLATQKPNSLKIATMLFKPTALRADVSPSYVGFEIENKFVLGYGLDYDGLGRNLAAIYVLQQDAPTETTGGN